ncbi:hypothetical protein MXL91_15650 [Achromobacter ruhlandii]|uniref:hypothetical protein n=1 Tax=Achromobacter ruhlandii TaxID=72557 RepID=UPI002DBD1D48|nr:hypothetical protein [Achromobacter ruhlandii]MEB6662889.1 hypothetical protein [Achromobacter ruhlandii]
MHILNSLSRRGIASVFTGKIAPIIMLAAVLALSAMFFVPGIVMSDTMTRWAGAHTIVGSLDIGWGLERWLAPTMTWFMVPFAATEHGAVYFLVAQIAYLLLGGVAWMCFSSCQRPWWVVLVFMIPLVFAYASFIVPDVWTLAAILMIVGCFYALEASRKAIALTVFFFSCVVLFGFRQNSLVLLPFVWFFICRLRNAARSIKAGMVALTIAALSVIHFVPPLLGFAGVDSSASAPAWELAGAIRVAKDSGVPLDSSLSLEGIADTDVAASRHSFVTINTLIWGSDAVIPTTVIMNQSSEIKSRWLQMVLRHPGIYLKTKLKIYECMIGLCPGDLSGQMSCMTPWPQLEGRLRTCSSNEFSSNTLSVVNRSQAMLEILLLPVFWIPLSAAIMFISWKKYSRHDRILIVLAAAYFASFFVFNQAATFRYFFPTYVVFTAYQIRFFLSLPRLLMNLKHSQS